MSCLTYQEEGGSEIAAPMVRLRRTMSLVQRPALYYIGPFGPRRNSFFNTCMLDSQALIYGPCGMYHVPMDHFMYHVPMDHVGCTMYRCTMDHVAERWSRLCLAKNLSNQ